MIKLLIFHRSIYIFSLKIQRGGSTQAKREIVEITLEIQYSHLTHFALEDGGSIFLRNIGNTAHFHMIPALMNHR
jgi:hypothetical protein